MLNRNDALRTVCMFATQNGKGFIYGTGFFVRKGEKLFVVTAQHVSNGFNNTTEIIVMGNNGISKKDLLSNIQQGPTINHNNADVSVTPIDEVKFNALQSIVIIFGYDLLNPTFTISRDVELTAIGFANGMGTSLYFMPFTFRSFPSSNMISNVILDNGKYKETAFFLENAGCGGFSGCPVIDLFYMASEGSVVEKEGIAIVYGIMHGTLSDATGGKMAIVTPSKYILDII